MSRDRYERKHRRTWRHPEAIAFMASADFTKVSTLAEALGLVEEPRLLGPLSLAPGTTRERMSRVQPTDGPRCYLCDRPFQIGDWIIGVAVGPKQDRSHFRAADAIDRHTDPNVALAADAHHDHDTIQVGAECARRYVPAEAVIGKRIR